MTLLTPSPATILIVDDDAANRHTFGWLFRDAGYRTLEAGTGQEAVQLAEQKPDLILLDVNLPDINGFEVCRRLRSLPETRHAAILQMSAVYVDSGDRSLGLEQGADAYLVKPVEPRELLAHIRALLRVRDAEQAYRRAAQEWRTTFDAINDVVCLLDRQGKILRCNTALRELVGREFDRLIGQSLDTVLRSGLGLDTSPGIPLLGRTPFREAQEVRLGDRWFRVTADPIWDDHGAQVGSVQILQDITPRVQLEEQLRQSQRLEAIGRLAAGIAHDFNNLLTAILGNASLLIRSLPRGEPEHELAVTMERAAWRAAELTRQLLGFSRQTLLWLEKVEVGLVLQQIGSEFRRRLPPGIDLRVQCADQLWPIQADPAHLGQVLTNLCENSLAAMPQGGLLWLEADNVTIEEQQVRSRVEARSGEFVRLRVGDTGTGIPADVIDKIFDPFFTTKPTGQGTGLGLAMVHGIVKQHQGWVDCHSEVGRGTVFNIYLPRLQAAPQHLTIPRPSLAASPSGTRWILLADDNETLRSLAASYLRQGGFQVVLAEDGQQAVERYRKDQARIDLVILDEMMPLLSGVEAMRQIQQINPTARVLLAGNQPLEGGLPTLPKPYREQELLQAVHAALNGQPASL